MKPLVIIESPYGGNVESNTKYARECLLDSLHRGEAPFASHLLYTQVLDDGATDERELGIEAGLAVGRYALKTIAYVDLGVSEGMRYGIQRADKEGRPVIYRRLYTHSKACPTWKFGECTCGAAKAAGGAA